MIETLHPKMPGNLGNSTFSLVLCTGGAEHWVNVAVLRYDDQAGFEVSRRKTRVTQQIKFEILVLWSDWSQIKDEVQLFD